MHIFGLYSSSASFPAMKTLTLRSLSNRENVSSLKRAHEVFRCGFGINFKLRPSRERRLQGGVNLVVISWKAVVVGILKYNHVGVCDNVIEVLCLTDFL
jgi:hypothetical protein